VTGAILSKYTECLAGQNRFIREANTANVERHLYQEQFWFVSVDFSASCYHKFCSATIEYQLTTVLLPRFHYRMKARKSQIIWAYNNTKEFAWSVLMLGGKRRFTFAKRKTNQNSFFGSIFERNSSSACMKMKFNRKVEVVGWVGGWNF